MAPKMASPPKHPTQRLRRVFEGRPGHKITPVVQKSNLHFGPATLGGPLFWAYVKVQENYNTPIEHTPGKPPSQPRKESRIIAYW